MLNDNPPAGPPAEHRPVRCSAELELESWLRTVRHLRAAGLAAVVPPQVSFRLLDQHGLIVHAPVELPWTAAA